MVAVGYTLMSDFDFEELERLQGVPPNRIMLEDSGAIRPPNIVGCWAMHSAFLLRVELLWHCFDRFPPMLPCHF